MVEPVYVGVASILKPPLLLTLLSPGPRKDSLALILRLLEWMLDVESVGFEAWKMQQIHSHGKTRSLTVWKVAAPGLVASELCSVSRDLVFSTVLLSGPENSGLVLSLSLCHGSGSDHAKQQTFLPKCLIYICTHMHTYIRARTCAQTDTVRKHLFWKAFL